MRPLDGVAFLYLALELVLKSSLSKRAAMLAVIHAYRGLAPPFRETEPYSVSLPYGNTENA